MKYIAKRIGYLLLTTFAVMTIVFIVLRILPGDPAILILGPDASVDSIAAMREKLGLNQPILVQYFAYLKSFITFDFGDSLAHHVPVLSLLKRALPYTITLSIAALLVSVVVGVPLGVMSALKRNGIFDFFSRVASLLTIGMPHFFLGLMMLLFFSYRLKWFPLLGGGSFDDPGSVLYHLILPAIAMGLPRAATQLRFTRANMLEVLGLDYVRTARAKGLREGSVIYKHALRNALLPVITIIGANLGQLLGGAFLMEVIFTRPGIGKLLLDGIRARDYPMVQVTIVFFAFMVAVINLLTDLLYSIADPRIQHK